MSRLISQLMQDSPLLLLPAISLSLFGLATVLIVFSTVRRRREDLTCAARLPLEGDSDHA